MRWDAARVASRRPLPREHKMHAPVGERLSALSPAIRQDRAFEPGPDRHEPSTCRACGHHVCSCEPVEPTAEWQEHIEQHRKLYESMNERMRVYATRYADERQKRIDSHNEAAAALYYTMTAPSLVVSQGPRTCGSCDNTVEFYENYCDDCIRRRRGGLEP